MLSEAFHSAIDTSNEGLLLYGQRRAQQPPTAKHPLGHGRELYFWSFVVAILIFALGSGLSFYEGIQQILKPTPIENVTVSYLVYGAAAVFEGTTWIISLRNFQKLKGDETFWKAVRHSKDPPALIVLFEDTADLSGIAIAAAGTALASLYNAPVFDGIASLGIGAVLALTAALLARESKSLLLGETADPATMDLIRETAARHPEIERVGDIVTVHLAPQQIVAALAAHFDPNVKASRLERVVCEIETDIKRKDPRVSSLFVKPQTAVKSEANTDEACTPEVQLHH
jgi:cation diffusion facilitator family transporter